MDIGEMQKRLSLKAEQQPDHRFDDLFSLICREDWLMLAHDHVAGNAGSQTAGCDGINLRAFDEDLGDNLKDLRGSLEEGTFRPTRNGACGPYPSAVRLRLEAGCRQAGEPVDAVPRASHDQD